MNRRSSYLSHDGDRVTSLDYRGATIQIRTWRDLMGAGKRKRAFVRWADGSETNLVAKRAFPTIFSSYESNETIFRDGKELIRSRAKVVA